MKDSKILNYCEGALVSFTAITLILLTMYIVVDVVGRYFFNNPLPATNSVAELLMPYIGFCSLSYTLYKGQHIDVTIMEELFPGLKKYFKMLKLLIGAVFCLLVFWGSWSFFWKSLMIREEMMSVIKLPWYIGKFALPLGFAFFFIRFTQLFFHEFKAGNKET